MSKTAKVAPIDIEKKTPDEVPEVKEFILAKAELDHFKKEHHDFFEKLEGLAEAYNTALENADKVLRANRISCGPFDLYSISKKYDATKLYEELGEEDFLKVGGTMSTITSYGLNAALFEALAERGSIPKEVVEKVRKITPSFHKPDKLELP